ncbi:MAG: arginine--tRNA ligase [Alphaproteobacteria bacterium]
MTALTSQLSAHIGAVFKKHNLPEELGAVRVSDRPDLAQFQCNGAMAAAKIAGKAPRAIAEDIVADLQQDPIFAEISIAGPGFINIKLTEQALSDHIITLNADENLLVDNIGFSKNVIVDYGGPNTAKPMHVGHLRASIIGESIKRVLKFVGYDAKGDIHLGDWGTHMGMVLSEFEIRHPEWPYFDKSKIDGFPSEPPITIQDLETLYPEASKASKSDEARMEISRQVTAELQKKQPGYYALWKHCFNVSVEAMKKNFAALDVYFELWLGESDAQDYIPEMVEGLQKQGHAIEDDGAIVIPVKQETDKKEYPPLILYKRDGSVMYGTTDLATLVQRMQDFTPVKVVYVVDQRQHLHFEQVFRAARLSNIVPEGTELTHAGFGTMNGQDGKPFKTRAGGVMKLEDLIQMGVEKATQRLDEANIGQDYSTEERADIAHKVAIAAIKFADLQNNRSADYIFDLDRLTSFEGKTGPYLLYQAVRIKSLLRKAADRGLKPESLNKVELGEHETTLALILSDFPNIVELTARNYTPHVLADYAYKLAQSFSSFYSHCPILNDDAEQGAQQSRLFLSALTLRSLEKTLDLLGIPTPERM